MTFFSSAFPLDQRQIPQIVAVQVKQIKRDQHDLCRLALQFVLQNCEVSRAIRGRHHDFAVDDRGASGDVPGIISNLAEAFGPVVTAARENLHGLVNDVHLDAIAIELDFVEPTLAAGHLLDRRRQRRFDEARITTLGADGWLIFALEGHGSHQPQGQVAMMTFMPFDEVLNG
jgi:hypothetical protein